MKKQYSTPWEETLWTAYDYKKPTATPKKSKMKKYAIASAVGLVAAAAFAQVPTPQVVEQYQTANPVDIVVTAKRPVAKKDASPRKSKVSTNKKTTTPTKSTKQP
jgi:hypothetical protein